MSRRPLWHTLFTRFDPERPPEDPSWVAPREHSPARAILDSLDRPFGTCRILLTGTTGTGKTTELRRIAAERSPKEFIVSLDLVQHFAEVVGDLPALQNISSWEVCFLAGLAVLFAAQDRLGFVLPEQHRKDLADAWSALATKSGEIKSVPQVDIGTLSRSMLVLASRAAPLVGPAGAGVGAGLELLRAATEGVKWTLPFGINKRALPDQDQQVQTLLRCVNVVINLIQHELGGKILLIIDGLDRIHAFERARALFIDSTAIAQIDCPMIVSGPFALRHHPALATIRGFSDVTPLVNEPVLLQRDPSIHGPGVAFFRTLFERRIADLDAKDLISSELLDKLAYYSGGRARDFVASIQSLAGYAWSEDKERVDEALVDKTLDDLRRKREIGLRRGHKDLLRSIMEDPDHALPDGELADELLLYSALLPYPNESEWFYPHPLLLMHLLRPRPHGSDESAPSSG